MSRLVSILGVAVSVSTLGCGGDDKKDDPAGSRAVVAGTLTFPASADDKPYGVELLTSPGTTAVASTSGRATAATTLAYSIADVPAGTYFWTSRWSSASGLTT